jgi:hypothetical protein
VRGLVALAACTIVVALAACGGTGNETSQTTSTATVFGLGRGTPTYSVDQVERAFLGAGIHVQRVHGIECEFLHGFDLALAVWVCQHTSPPSDMSLHYFVAAPVTQPSPVRHEFTSGNVSVEYWSRIPGFGVGEGDGAKILKALRSLGFSHVTHEGLHTRLRPIVGRWQRRSNNPKP